MNMEDQQSTSQYSDNTNNNDNNNWDNQSDAFNSTHEIINKKKYEETNDESKLRFEMELEFVQLLANASYLQYLAQYKYFEDPGFIEYCKYLQYWKKPEYARFIKYPYCLFMLDRIVNDEQFREDCKTVPFRDMLHQQMLRHWGFYRKNREEAIKQVQSFD